MAVNWMIQMFLASMVGSLASLFWPLLIALWRKQSNALTRSFGLEGAIGARRRTTGLPGPPIVRFLYRLVEVVLMPFVFAGAKVLLFLVVALLIALVSSAVGFAAFLQNEETRKALQ